MALTFRFEVRTRRPHSIPARSTSSCPPNRTRVWRAGRKEYHTLATTTAQIAAAQQHPEAACKRTQVGSNDAGGKSCQHKPSAITTLARQDQNVPRGSNRSSTTHACNNVGHACNNVGHAEKNALRQQQDTHRSVLEIHDPMDHFKHAR